MVLSRDDKRSISLISLISVLEIRDINSVYVRISEKNMRTLSSEWTFFYKFVFPVLWMGFIAYIILAMFAATGSPGFSGNFQFVILSAMTVLASGWWYWISIRLKKVTLKDDLLLISDFRKQVEIPLRDVERVSGSILMNPELVWLHLARPTEFGEKIVFMAKFRFFSGLTRNPVVEELDRLIRLQRLNTDWPTS